MTTSLADSVDDLAHHVALGGRRLREHGVERGHDRHFQARQQLDDIAAGLAAENPVLVLEARDVVAGAVQELGRPHVVTDHVVADLEADGGGIRIATTGVRHGDDAGLEVRPGRGHRPMQVVGEGRDPATTRKVIADERHTLEQIHLVVSKRLSVEATVARVEVVGTWGS